MKDALKATSAKPRITLRRTCREQRPGNRLPFRQIGLKVCSTVPPATQSSDLHCDEEREGWCQRLAVARLGRRWHAARLFWGVAAGSLVRPKAKGPALLCRALVISYELRAVNY